MSHKLNYVISSIMILILVIAAVAYPSEDDETLTLIDYNKAEVVAQEMSVVRFWDKSEEIRQEREDLITWRQAEHIAQQEAIWNAEIERQRAEAARRQAERRAAERQRQQQEAAAQRTTTAVANTDTPNHSGDIWWQLALCESGGNNVNTGNGYYGYFQFLPSTWRSVGGTGLPHEHSYSEQLHRAQILQQRSGWGQWPSCSRQLGLR